MENRFGVGDLSNLIWDGENYPQQGNSVQHMLTDLNNYDNQQNQLPEANEQVEDCLSIGPGLQLSSASRRQNITASPSLDLFEGLLDDYHQPITGVEHNQAISPTLQLPSDDQPDANEQVEDSHSVGPALQLSSGTSFGDLFVEFHKTNQPSTSRAEHNQAIDPTSQPASDYHQNQRPSVTEQLLDCHSIGQISQLSPASQENNSTQFRAFSRNASLLDSTKNQPAVGGGSIIERNQPAQLASVAPSTNNFGGYGSTALEQPGEKEKNESNIKEKKRICQKRSRDKKKQEAVEIKEKLERATSQNDDLRRRLAEFEKTIETKEKKINELRMNNSKLRDAYEKVQDNTKDLERKNEKLKGKNLKLKDRLRQVKTEKIGKSDKLTTSWTKFPLKNRALKIKNGSYYVKFINDDDMSCY